MTRPLPAKSRSGRRVIVLTGQPRRGDEQQRLPDADGDEGQAEVGPGDRSAGVAQPGGGPVGGWHGAEVDEQVVGAGPGRQDSASATRPDHRSSSPLSGQRSQTSDSWSMAVNTAPARAGVAGNVTGTPGPGSAWNTPRTSDRSTTAWPAMVDATAGRGDQDGVDQAGPWRGEPGAGPVVPPERDHGHDGQRERRHRAVDQRRGRSAAGACAASASGQPLWPVRWPGSSVGAVQVPANFPGRGQWRS
jgi:hypothetical protein